MGDEDCLFLNIYLPHAAGQGNPEFLVIDTRLSASLCEASVLMVARPAASHPPNLDDIYHAFTVYENTITFTVQYFTPVLLRVIVIVKIL